MQKPSASLARLYLRITLVCFSTVLLSGCPSAAVKRKAGQSELFVYDPAKGGFYPPQSKASQLPWIEVRQNVAPQFGDRIRFASDTMLIRVESVYLADRPATLTQSSDVLLFAEVWENAAAGPAETPLTYILYSEKNQLIPGRLNFTGAIAYGPTYFKGHPLKLKFTLMIVQKEKGKEQSNVADVVSKYAAAVPSYGAFLTPAAAVIRDVLRAQPDIIAFDFETVLISDKPEKLGKSITATRAAAGAALGGGAGLAMAVPRGLTTAELAQQQADNGVRDIWQTWQRSFGWLQYGQYLIAETATRSSNDVSTGSGPAVARNRYERGKTNGLFPTAGWVLTGARPGLDDLANTYLIFSIVPGQLAEDDGTIRDASAAAARLVGTLRQTEENVSAAMTTINQTAKDLKYAVIKNQAESLADKIAKAPGMTLGAFRAEFGRQYDDLINSLGPLDNDVPATEREGIRKRIDSRYQSIFEEIKRGEVSSVEQKVFDPAAAAVAKLLTDEAQKIDALVAEIQALKDKRETATVADEARQTLINRWKALEKALQEHRAASSDQSKLTARTAAVAAKEEGEKARGESEKLKQTWGQLLTGTTEVNAKLAAIRELLNLAETQLRSLKQSVADTTQAAATEAAGADTQERLDKVKRLAADAAAFKTKYDTAHTQYSSLKKTESDLHASATALLGHLAANHADLAQIIAYGLDGGSLVQMAEEALASLPE